MKKKKSGNVKRRNVQRGKVASVITIIEGYEYKGIQTQPLQAILKGAKSCL